MTNYEKYKEWFNKNELAFRYCGAHFAFDTVKQEVVFCDSMPGCSDCKFKEHCRSEVQLEWLNSEVEEIPDVDWSKVEVDTKIQVKNREEDEWTNAYFAGYVAGQPLVFNNGATSFTSSTTNRTIWPIVRLYKED